MEGFDDWKKSKQRNVNSNKTDKMFVLAAWMTGYSRVEKEVISLMFYHHADRNGATME